MTLRKPRRSPAAGRLHRVQSVRLPSGSWIRIFAETLPGLVILPSPASPSPSPLFSGQQKSDPLFTRIAFFLLPRPPLQAGIRQRLEAAVIDHLIRAEEVLQRGRHHMHELREREDDHNQEAKPVSYTHLTLPTNSRV